MYDYYNTVVVVGKEDKLLKKFSSTKIVIFILARLISIDSQAPVIPPD